VRRQEAGILLLALGAGWTGGNVGPVVDPVAREFDVSLAAVGLLMTLFFAAIAVVTIAAPRGAERRRAGPAC
jgi:cyanate permease